MKLDWYHGNIQREYAIRINKIAAVPDDFTHHFLPILGVSVFTYSFMNDDIYMEIYNACIGVNLK